MLNWLFGKAQEHTDPSKTHHRIVPIIASIVDGVVEDEGIAGLLTPYSTIILRCDYNVLWYGDSEPHVLDADELACAYLHECKHYDKFRRAFEIGQDGTVTGSFLIKQSVDIISAQLGVLLRDRANVPDLRL